MSSPDDTDSNAPSPDSPPPQTPHNSLKRATLGENIKRHVADWVHSLELGKFETVNGMHRGAQLTIAIASVFVVSDFFLLYPDRVQWDFIYCLACRLLMIGSCCAYVIWGHNLYQDPNPETRNDQNDLKSRAIVGLLLLQLIGHLTSLISIIIGGAESNYFAGVVMVLVGIAVLVPLKPGVFAAKAALMIAVYTALLCYYEGHLIPSLRGLSNLSLMVGGAAVSWYGCRVMERLRDRQANPEPDSNASKRLPRNLADIFKVMLAILVPVGTATVRGLNLEPANPDDSTSIRSINLIGKSAPDASIEFRNVSPFTIILEGAQIYHRTDGDCFVIPIQKSGDNFLKVASSETVRVYLKEFSPGDDGYFVTLSDEDRKRILEASSTDIFLTGFRIDPESKGLRYNGKDSK